MATSYQSSREIADGRDLEPGWRSLSRAAHPKTIASAPYTAQLIFPVMKLPFNTLYCRTIPLPSQRNRPATLKTIFLCANVTLRLRF